MALTHRSWCAEQPGYVDNERLEFLGDAVLGLVVTDRIFERYPNMSEGELAKLRSSVVSATSLAVVGAGLDVGSVMRLGKGEEASGGRTKPSILADAVEALIAAVYLDAGADASRRVVLGLLGAQIELNAQSGPGRSDYKTQLQELTVRRFDQPPRYEVRDEGPDHERWFYATVRIGGVVWGQGEGRTKKQAEQAAARDAGERIRAETTTRTGAGGPVGVGPTNEAVRPDGGNPAAVDVTEVASTGAGAGTSGARSPATTQPESGVDHA